MQNTIAIIELSIKHGKSEEVLLIFKRWLSDQHELLTQNNDLQRLGKCLFIGVINYFENITNDGVNNIHKNQYSTWKENGAYGPWEELELFYKTDLLELNNSTPLEKLS
jgi:hypothetical protein